MVIPLPAFPRALLAAFMLWATAAAAAVDVKVGVDPNPPVAGESFRIAFEVTGDLDEEPDFGPIEQRFDVLGRNRQTSIQWVNGNHTRTATFVLEVLPKPGMPLEIPSIAFDDFRTRPVRLTATADAAPATPPDDGLFLEIDAEPRNPYVQQQVIYTIRLWRRYELSNASLSQPRLRTDAIVRPLGEDRQFEAERDGRRYEVIERRFALFPQKSGATVIEPVTVTAQVLERASSLFEMFGRAVKTRRVSSKTLELDVRPIPAAFPPGAAWLPARKVRLNELWDPESLAVNTGDPATRTLSLWASGLTSGQLPELSPSVPPGLKAYPDQPQLKEDVQGDGVTAVRQEKIALIPEQPGTYEVGELSVPWWNVDTDSLEYAQVPAHPVHARAPASATPPAAPVVTAPVASPPAAAAPPATSVEVPDWRHWPGWFAVSCALLIAWAVSVGWLLRRGTARTVTSSASVPPVTANAARATLLAACRAHDPRAARAALLAWAEKGLPADEPWTLDALARLSHEPLAQAIRALDAALYGRTPTAWQGDALAATFNAGPPAAPHARRAVDPLPEIFRLAN